MTSFFKKGNRILSLVLCVAALSLLVASCSGPTYQGWSGFASSDGVLYFGGIDGKVYAISPTNRSQNLSFPSEGEWVFSIPSVGAPGAICGLACAPTAPRANIYATPVVVGELVCVGVYAGDNGKLIAINRLAPGYTEGVPLRSKGEWTYPSGVKSVGAIVGNPVLVDETLYVGSSDGKLYVIDAVYGEKKWEFDTGGKVWTSPVVDGDIVYVSNYERKLFAISRTDDSQIWSIELPASIASSPAISADNIIVGTFDNRLYAFDRTNGKEKWNFEGGNWFWSTPIVTDNIVYAGCLDNKIYAIDASTGRELWQFMANGPVVSTPVSANNLIIVASESGDIYVLDPANGKLVQSIHIGSPIKAPLFVEDNIVYVHTGNQCICGIDIQNGKEIWKFCYSSIE